MAKEVHCPRKREKATRPEKNLLSMGLHRIRSLTLAAAWRRAPPGAPCLLALCRPLAPLAPPR
eukprot:11165835-Lingulodinium_polyedra.AAC.1